MKTIDSSEHMAPKDDEYTVTKSKSMKDTSQKIQEAGTQDTTQEDPGEEEAPLPEPKMKTAAELLEDPNEALKEEGEELQPEEKDALPVDEPANGEELESMKNKNADGDEPVKKEGEGEQA